ncbi:MAG: enoyl-CoA hydratase [Ignavibacteriae bacterium HGW-Ignavibacteriae-4]|jgi:methylglutaconyl-CoA hydratase|nr:MAG: enoyl-CoA hydratase [Ignavibacteriae bacterium HGW-Ignavibacteriae-4]
MNPNGDVSIQIENQVATIEFYHPSSNALPGNVLRKLAETIETAGKNEEISVIVLKSGGDRAFCAGASFDELISITDFPTGKNFFMGFALVINAMRKCPKFIICRVQGKAVGGGVGLLSAADYTLATKYSSVKLSELALGIGPFVVGPAVERKIGTSSFAQMSIDYDWYDAEWAKSRGFYANIYDSIEELDTAVAAFATKMAGNSPEAMKELKQVTWVGTEHWDALLESRAEISGRLVLSDFTKNYITQFKDSK